MKAIIHMYKNITRCFAYKRKRRQRKHSDFVETLHIGDK